MNLYNLHSNPEELYGYQRRSEIPELAYEIAQDRYNKTGKRSPNLEPVIGSNPESACWYAYYILKRRWAKIGMPEVERVIGSDPRWAYLYARYVLDGRWADIDMPEVERVISSDPDYWRLYSNRFKIRT